MRPRDERGFTLIELMIAMVILIVGITALAETFVAAGRLTVVSERQAAMSHAGRSELERLQSLGYAQLEMKAAPGSSVSPTNPDYYVTSQASNYYLQVDPSSSAKEQLVIDAANGGVPGAATTWSSGNTSGLIYDFVTYHTDGACGVGCPASQNYKRIVVEVTQSTAGSPKYPTIIQTVVVDPASAPTGFVANGVQNPLQSAATQCGSPPASCQIGIDQGNANSFYLYDQPATGTYGGPPTVSNALHNTVGVLAGLLCVTGVSLLGCPVPDLMSGTSPASASSTLLNYSTDLGGPSGSTAGGGSNYQGGRLLKVSSTTCATPPSANSSTSNAAAATWVTGPVGAAETLNGQGGMSMFMQSANGLTASVTLCVAIWVYPQSLLNLISLPPARVGLFAEAVASLPATPIPVSFTFSLAGTASLVIGQRIGVEVWLAASSSANVAIQYDNPAFASQLQLNTS